MKLRCFKLSLLFFVVAMASSFAQYAPYFQNFSLAEYKAGNQNWDVSRAEGGKVYVANSNGLLEFDGLTWTLNELPNKTTVRSVLAYKDVVYTGSYEEFGYWKANGDGRLHYTSLSDNIKSQISNNEEIWQIIAFKDRVIFKSFLNLYVLLPDGAIDKINPSSTVISCSVVGDQLFVATLNDGIFVLEDDVLKPFLRDDRLLDTKVIKMEAYQNGVLIATSLKGCFLYRNNHLFKTSFPINETLIKHQLNDFSMFKDGGMVFGTIQDGVYMTNDKGNVLFHINKENGLENNTILRQHVDMEQMLWLGLDNGLASVDLSSHNYFFNDVSGRLGSVYDVINYQNVIYIGSNTGLFYLDSQNKLQFIEGSQGQVWNLEEVDGELFCGHNDGTYIVENKQLFPVSTFTGGYTIKKVPEAEDTYVQGSYTGLIRYHKKSGEWQVKHLGRTTMPIRFLVFEDEHTAWAAHAYKGLYKVKFDNGYDTITSIENYDGKGIWSNFNVRVYKIKNDICFKTNEGWQKYEPILDSIVPYKLLNENFGRESYVISEDDVDKVVLKTKNDVIRFVSFEDDEGDMFLSSSYFKNRLIVGNENISKITDSTYALNLNDGFMLIDDALDMSRELTLPQVESIEIDKEPVGMDVSGPIEIEFDKSLAIAVSSPKSENHFFEYSFLNLDSSKWYRMDSRKLELSNLSNGNYQLGIRASNAFQEHSPMRVLEVYILPPWYKDTMGFVLYALLIAALLVIIYLYHRHKIEKEQRLLQLKFEKEQEELLRKKTLENEKEIVHLKNESLQNELKLKSKQLANTAMALVKKNETLQEIKKELSKSQESFDNYYAYKKIVKKVDNSIEHKDEWKIFEYNFNQVHEEFFNGLKSKFPKLTHKDLKLSAYIKMNLTNKEIAPLMNISVRGVETHRYRLKKKFDLENDTSLTDFLHNFK
ncbi:helix-turn-helix and ligand-binding sensor domain-containing protein [Mangrovimonas xylaniphaga]|uniref:helix-turn-helix and ligand-binding sensor domain-containing protein n=1 Tax=Mangrovimonas xylaniphaga TaxID=1645915 RepID=UPI0006B61CFF|nr:LuxR C-terminal-related transcriptional regulator [Mangrovimonas xylaniphaga]